MNKACAIFQSSKGKGLPWCKPLIASVTDGMTTKITLQ